MAENETPEENETLEDVQVDEHVASEAAAEASSDEPEAAPEVDEEAEADAEPVAEVGAGPATQEEPAVGEAEPAAEEVAAQAPAADAAEQARRKRKRVSRGERRQRSKPKREQPKERKPLVRLPKPEAVRGARPERRGVVVSSAADKTIVVRVETLKSHPRYKKIIRRSAKLHAHDERNEAKLGDVVRIVETRPISKTKRWRLAEILEVAK